LNARAASALMPPIARHGLPSSQLPKKAKLAPLLMI
jgi:hypothetical protein